MTKSTESKLACLYSEWVANGSIPQDTTSDFGPSKLRADVFGLVMAAKLSALVVARRIYHSKLMGTDAPPTKKLRQDRIACVVCRTRKRLNKNFRAAAEDHGIVHK